MFEANFSQYTWLVPEPKNAMQEKLQKKIEEVEGNCYVLAVSAVDSANSEIAMELRAQRKILQTLKGLQ